MGQGPCWKLPEGHLQFPGDRGPAPGRACPLWSRPPWAGAAGVSLLFLGGGGAGDKSHEVLPSPSPPFLSPSGSQRGFLVYPTRSLDRTWNLSWRETGRSWALPAPHPHPHPHVWAKRGRGGGLRAWGSRLAITLLCDSGPPRGPSEPPCSAAWVRQSPPRVVVRRKTSRKPQGRCLSRGGCCWGHAPPERHC